MCTVFLTEEGGYGFNLKDPECYSFVQVLIYLVMLFSTSEFSI